MCEETAMTYLKCEDKTITKVRCDNYQALPKKKCSIRTSDGLVNLTCPKCRGKPYAENEVPVVGLGKKVTKSSKNWFKNNLKRSKSERNQVPATAFPSYVPIQSQRRALPRFEDHHSARYQEGPSGYGAGTRYQEPRNKNPAASWKDDDQNGYPSNHLPSVDEDIGIDEDYSRRSIRSLEDDLASADQYKQGVWSSELHVLRYQNIIGPHPLSLKIEKKRFTDPVTHGYEMSKELGFIKDNMLRRAFTERHRHLANQILASLPEDLNTSHYEPLSNKEFAQERREIMEEDVEVDELMKFLQADIANSEYATWSPPLHGDEHLPDGFAYFKEQRDNIEKRWADRLSDEEEVNSCWIAELQAQRFKAERQGRLSGRKSEDWMGSSHLG